MTTEPDEKFMGAALDEAKKALAIKPMSVDDAALRMEQSTEAFVVFRNPESSVVSIVYRRKDGQLGLIEPD